MKKLIVLCGISGSGKSHFAHTEWEKDPLNTLIVSRDNIRYMFGFTEKSVKDYYSRTDLSKLEKQITLYEDTLIHEGLNLDKTVIVDATHLTVPFLKRYEFWNVPIEYKYFDVSVVEAVARDSRRTRKVGVEVIRKQHNKYSQLKRLPDFEPINFKQDEELHPCIIYDIDGTIAKKGNRSAYDWKAVGKDDVIDSVVSTIDIAEGSVFNPRIIICTGRDAVCEKETKQWLEDNEIFFHDIYFRPQNDMRPDWIVKEEMWRKIAKTNYIVGMYDDRNQVTRRARALGLKVFQVEYGNF